MHSYFIIYDSNKYIYIYIYIYIILPILLNSACILSPPCSPYNPRPTPHVLKKTPM